MRTEPISRRSLFLGRPAKRNIGICPPGATAESLNACTGCGLCAERCPTGIIRLSDGMPSIDFAFGECTFCGECSSVCPEPVFLTVNADRFPHVAVVGDGCLAKRHVACQSCGECCPEQAIGFRPRMGGPFVPEMNEALCNGCGACLSICPVSAIGLRARDAEAADV